jgi:hypothetical protein
MNDHFSTGKSLTAWLESDKSEDFRDINPKMGESRIIK